MTRSLLFTSPLWLFAMPFASAGPEPVFVPIKIDGPVHDPARSSFWYGPFSEGAALLDVNGDGELDITCGPSWYEGPRGRSTKGFVLRRPSKGSS
jgi:hypothetical protein